MYRYSSSWDWIPVKNGKRTIPPNSGNGWYTTFDKIDDIATANTRLHLPPASSANYRIEYKTSSVKNNSHVPYGDHVDSAILEPKTIDFPTYGEGGASQILVKEAEIPIEKVWDLSTNPPTQVYSATP